MHFLSVITLIPLFLLSQPILVSGNTSAQVSAQFYPYPSTGHHDESSDKSLHTAKIYSGTCQSFPNPHLYTTANQKFTKVSMHTKITKPYSKCLISIHEIAGCVDRPLVEKESRHEVTVTEYKAKDEEVLEQIWIKFVCEEEKHEEKHEEKKDDGNAGGRSRRDEADRPSVLHKLFMNQSAVMMANSSVAMGNHTLLLNSSVNWNSSIHSTGGRVTLRKAFQWHWERLRGH